MNRAQFRIVLCEGKNVVCAGCGTVVDEDDLEGMGGICAVCNGAEEPGQP